jgi:NitT/TauT family transport system substrate-binding protein
LWLGNAAPCAAAAPVIDRPFDKLAVPVALKIGLVGAYSDAGLFIAEEHGYFRELGLTVAFIGFPNSSKMVAPLGANDLDIAGGAVAPGLWNAEARQIGIKAVADKGSVRPGFSYEAWVVKPGSPVRDCAGLRGKSIGNAAPANSMLHGLDIFLHGCGLGIGDVTIRTLAYPDVAPALASDAVEVAQLNEPLLSIYLQKGLVEIFHLASDFRASEQAAVLQISPGLAARPDIARRFFVAYARGVADYAAYLQIHPLPEAFVDILLKHTGVTDRHLFDRVIPAYLAPFGSLEVDSLRLDFDWFRAHGFIASASVRFEDAIDTSFTDYARAYLARYPAK